MIKLIKSTFYKEEETRDKLASFIKRASKLSMGEECSKFEIAFSEKQGRKFAVMVNSGSSANLVLIQALLNLGIIQRGDKVGFSALTWSTNVMPIIQLGLIPIPIDCEIDTLNISPETLKLQIDNIKILFLTNVLGFCDNIVEIKNLCEANNVILLEDNCEALGSSVSGTLLGNFGLASTFSFFVGHHISTIEGGMIVTDDEDLYHELLITRSHGWDRNLPPGKQKKLRDSNHVDEFFAKYTFYDLAYNVRPTEINGFLGNEQLRHWDEIVSKRRSNFDKFNDAVNKNSDFIHFRLKHMDVISNFAMPVICKDKDTFVKYKDIFVRNKIEIRPVVAGDITSQPFYKKYVLSKTGLNNAKFIRENGFYFANNPELSEKEIDFLCDLLIKF